MPIYEFKCKKCGVQYDELVWTIDKTGKYPGVECPECGSKSKVKLVSLAKCSFANPVGTDLYENSHDYRHNHNMNREGGVRDQRAAAEAASTVGPTPYNNIDDISSGKHFGEVK
jgi:putative FmdB family regulatory protein